MLVENIPNELSTPERLVEFIHTMHFDDIGVCFDCGHAHMMEGIPEGFAILKDHICSTHVHDNNKDKDSHLWPGSGSIDWKQTMELLRTAPQKPPLLLEIDGDEKKNPSVEVSRNVPKAGRFVRASRESEVKLQKLIPQRHCSGSTSAI